MVEGPRMTGNLLRDNARKPGGYPGDIVVFWNLYPAGFCWGRLILVEGSYAKFWNLPNTNSSGSCVAGNFLG